jgi:phage terminase small subunit
MPRPKKPVALHIIQGTARKDRMAARVNEMALPAGPVGEAPEWLIPDARAEWDLLTQHAVYSRVLSPAHRGALIEYCVLFGRMVLWAKGEGEISASERQTLNSLRMQLGITPASQGKVKMPEQKPAESKWGATKPTGT